MFTLSRRNLCVFVVCLLGGAIVSLVAIPLQLVSWDAYLGTLGRAGIVCIGALIGSSLVDKLTTWKHSRSSAAGAASGDVRSTSSDVG